MGTEILVVMKTIKISIGIVLLLLLMQGFGYLNLMVSDKYETQPEGLIEITQEVQEKINNKTIEIQNKKARIKIYSLILVITLTCLVVIWSRNASKEKTQIKKESQE